VLFHGSGDYVGLTAPGVVRVTADGARVHRVATIRGRLFALELPRHTGPVTLRQRAADGRVVARQRIRG
jgi:hypothetical protein